MDKDSKIFVAGGTGMVGSAIIRRLISEGYNNIISNYHKRTPNASGLQPLTSNVIYIPLDLERQTDVEAFFEKERPEYVFLAAAQVGGIYANSTYPADFIYNNLIIEANVIKTAHKYGVKKILFLGSSCIYPRLAPQPMKEEYLLSGPLEPTNEAYAIAKIAGIKMCQAYNQQYGTNFISVMPTNLHGPNDNYDSMNSFAGAFGRSSGSLVGSAHLISKVYFPRLVIPISSLLSGLLDFAIAFVVLIGLMFWYHIVPTVAILWLPAFLLMAVATALGVGLWLGALNVQYRDVGYLVPFLSQIWMYATPVVYPTSLIPERWQLLYGLNPMAGVVEGFRWALLGKGSGPGPMLAVSVLVTVVLLISGAYYFRRMEKTFADIV